ncbi:MAG TPA: tetratricopeptide repeat protein [Tepidisphaeraceae bacterium]|nr:tetratricopeptide repeat protein [Tepidisphaeraceae bacterium]
MKHRTFNFVFLAAVAGSLVGLVGVGCQSNAGSGGIKGVDQYVKAVQAYNAGDRDRAILNLTAATRANPDLIMARLMLGDLYREGGNYNEAVGQYETLVKLDPYTWTNYYKLGVSYQFLQRLQEAASSYQRALKLNPDDPNSNMNLGLVYLYLGDPEEAVRFTERATLLDPKSAAAFSNLGVALDARGEYNRAESAYRHSLDLDPQNPTTLLNLGTNLIAQNKGGEAVDILQRVIDMEDSPLHRKRFGDALAKAGRYDDAVAQYQSALKLDPKYYPAMNEIGWSRIAEFKNNLELDDAKREQALAMWDQSLTINPEQPKIEAAKKEWSERPLFRP